MHIGTSLLCTSFRIMGRDLPPCLDLRVRTETASPAGGRFLTILREVYVIGGEMGGKSGCAAGGSQKIPSLLLAPERQHKQLGLKSPTCQRPPAKNLLKTAQGSHTFNNLSSLNSPS